MNKNNKNFYRLKDEIDWDGRKNTAESSTEHGGW